jgi:hypothetical protein
MGDRSRDAAIVLTGIAGSLRSRSSMHIDFAISIRKIMYYGCTRLTRHDLSKHIEMLPIKSSFRERKTPKSICVN